MLLSPVCELFKVMDCLLITDQWYDMKFQIRLSWNSGPFRINQPPTLSWLFYGGNDWLNVPFLQNSHIHKNVNNIFCSSHVYLMINVTCKIFFLLSFSFIVVRMLNMGSIAEQMLKCTLLLTWQVSRAYSSRLTKTLWLLITLHTPSPQPLETTILPWFFEGGPPCPKTSL